MIDDKVLYTEKVPAGKRIYFIDVKEDRNGFRILKITENRKNEGQVLRQSVLIFEEDFDKFFVAFEKIKSFIQSTNQSDEAGEEIVEKLE